MYLRKCNSTYLYVYYLFILYTSCILFKDPFSNFKDLLLPVGWMLYQDVCMVSLYKINKSSSNEIKIIIEKQIVFQSSSTNISYYVNQTRKDSAILGLKQLTYPLDMTEIANTVQLFDSKHICQGGPSVINFPGTYLYNIC